MNSTSRPIRPSLATSTAAPARRISTISASVIAGSCPTASRYRRRAWKCLKPSYSRTSGRLRERARPVERRPSGSIRAVRHEKRQQPPLDAERYARGRRGRAGREPDGERFAEERLVIVERRGRRSSRPPEGQDELVLERFQLLQHRLAPRRGREERVARLHHPAVQPERARQRGGGAHPPLPERLDVAPLAQADDLAHRERPVPLERAEPRTLVPPAGTLRRYERRVRDGATREPLVDVVAHGGRERGVGG